jgi:glycosyltransferase involved in cell wall biosynthesis
MGDPAPKVTVGMPVYNDPDGLRRTIPGIMGQTWDGPLRLLVVDDGSTDATPQVLEEMKATYGRIDVIRNEPNRGRPFARNTILEHAADEYLAWIDAGDLWHPRKLELQFATLLSEEASDPGRPLLCISPLRWLFFDRQVDRVKVPQLVGDQLYNALVGTLYPYLPTLLGRTEHYRAIGGFDERLLRRQDYDLLVRFVGEGGRIVGTPPDPPLWTYLKSDVGASARVVARANRVIRSKHRTYYDNYGRRTYWQVRHNQHLLVARFHGNNGRKVRAALWWIWARMLDPAFVTAGGNVLRHGATTLRRVLTAALRPLVRWAAPVKPSLRRAGVTGFVRRIGLTDRLSRAGFLRPIYEEVGASDPAQASHPALTAARRSIAREAYEEAASLLERAARDETGASDEVWLLLEQVHRERGAFDSARSALERGLAADPASGALRVRLVELLGLRREWLECVELWSRLEEDDQRHFSAITYVRVARSYRRSGRSTAALEVAAEGVQRFPLDTRLREEYYTDRAALIDWPGAVVGSTTPRSVQDQTPVGTVTGLGSLVGDDSPVVGEVSPPAGVVATVTLNVNGLPVASTSAAPDAHGDGLRFSLSCHELSAYLGDGDVVSFSSEGRPITVVGYGDRCVIVTGYDSRFATLRQRLESGYVFTKFGQLRPGNTTERTDRILALYNEVAEVVSTATGHAVFPFYGNLLGAIREHDLIAHDVGGFDMGYVSSAHAAEEVRREFLDICEVLIQHGYHLILEPWSTYVRADRHDDVFVDLNYAWFTGSGELHLSFGWRYPPVTDRERFFYPRRSSIGRHLVRVPGNAEDVLEQIYGPAWPIPDQGFELGVELKRDPAFLLTVDEMEQTQAGAPDQVQVRLEDHPVYADPISS